MQNSVDQSVLVIFIAIGIMSLGTFLSNNFNSNRLIEQFIDIISGPDQGFND